MDKQDKQQELLQTLAMLKSQNPQIRDTAIENLRKTGWLYDGSLVSLDFSDSDAVKTILDKFNRGNLSPEESNLFSGFDLSGINLVGTDFSGADLRGISLNRADLRGVNFDGANLSRANLSLTNLARANLARANLSKATLLGANLREVNLTETNLDQAIVADTNFSNLDMSEVIRLETVRHFLPSTVGIDTLVKSKGKIPEVFLRGCGVPASFIAYIPSLIGQAIEYYSCFISYSHVNADFAQLLYQRLYDEGVSCWQDAHNLPVGEFLLNELDRNIIQQDRTILCCSETALESLWVRREIGILLQEEERIYKETKKEVSKLIPLDIDGAIADSRFDSSITRQIRQRNIQDCRDWKNHDAFEEMFKKIVAALKAGQL